MLQIRPTEGGSTVRYSTRSRTSASSERAERISIAHERAAWNGCAVIGRLTVWHADDERGSARVAAVVSGLDRDHVFATIAFAISVRAKAKARIAENETARVTFVALDVNDAERWVRITIDRLYSHVRAKPERQ